MIAVTEHSEMTAIWTVYITTPGTRSVICYGTMTGKAGHPAQFSFDDCLTGVEAGKKYDVWCIPKGNKNYAVFQAVEAKACND